MGKASFAQFSTIHRFYQIQSQGLAYMLHQQYYQNDWSALFAAVSMVMIPTLLVYAIFQSQIQKGITVGALKG